MGAPAKFFVQKPFGPIDPLGLGKSRLNILNPRFPALPAPAKSIDPGPAAAEARRQARIAALGRKGRKSTILSGGAGVTGETPLSQPQALGA